MAMAIGAIDSIFDWGSLAPQSRQLAILRCGLSYKERNGHVLEYDDDRYACSFGDQPAYNFGLCPSETKICQPRS